MSKISPCLWYAHEAEQAAELALTRPCKALGAMRRNSHLRSLLSRASSEALQGHAEQSIAHRAKNDAPFVRPIYSDAGTPASGVDWGVGGGGGMRSPAGHLFSEE